MRATRLLYKELTTTTKVDVLQTSVQQGQKSTQLKKLDSKYIGKANTVLGKLGIESKAA